MVSIEQLNKALSVTKQAIDAFKGTYPEHMVIQEAWQTVMTFLNENEKNLGLTNPQPKKEESKNEEKK